MHQLTHGHKLRHSRLDEPQLYQQGPAPWPSAPSLLFGGDIRHYVEERKGMESKDQAITSYRDELAEAEWRGMEKFARGLDPTVISLTLGKCLSV